MFLISLFVLRLALLLALASLDVILVSTPLDFSFHSKFQKVIATAPGTFPTPFQAILLDFAFLFPSSKVPEESDLILL